MIAHSLLRPEFHNVESIFSGWRDELSLHEISKGRRTRAIRFSL
jgi:hypothetical protein